MLSGYNLCWVPLQAMLLPPDKMLQERVNQRAQQGTHFMPPALLADQLATLELPPTSDDFFYCLPGAGLPPCPQLPARQLSIPLQLCTAPVARLLPSVECCGRDR